MRQRGLGLGLGVRLDPNPNPNPNPNPTLTRCGSEGARWSARVRQPLSSATPTPQVKLRGTAGGACEGTFTPVARGKHTLAVLLGGRPLSGCEIVMDVRDMYA